MIPLNVKAYEAMEEAWKRARFVHQVEDTPAARNAFYAGGMHVLLGMIEAFADDQTLATVATKLNQGLHAFVTITIQREAT